MQSIMRKKITRALAAAALIVLIPCTASAADSFSLQSIFVDSKLYITAPLRWDTKDWGYFGLTAAMVTAAHQYDDNVRAHFTQGAHAMPSGGSQNSLRDALPAVAIVTGTFAYAALLNDRDGYRETWSLLEAGALSTASGEALKIVAGRQRPDVTTSPDHWRSGGDSFPSVHASAAFAVGMVFAESGNDEYRWVRRVIGYGVAGATAYIRVRNNDHWLSDTVAGAALGAATARFVLNRRVAESDDANVHGSVQITPSQDGWMLSYVYPLR
jgi:hypothetical protein